MGWGLVPSYSRQRKSFASGVSSIWKSINNIYDQLNVEINNYDRTQVDFNMGSTPSFVDLCAIPAGDSSGSRHAHKIRLKSINVKFKVDANSSTSSGDTTVMLVKHYDNFLGNAPVYADMYPAITGIDSDMLLRDLEKGSKTYKILARRKIRLEPEGNESQMVNIFYRFKRKAGSYVEWDGDSASSVSNGKVYLVFFHDGNLSVNPLVQYTTRTTYIDN